MSSASGDANTVIGYVIEATGPVIVINQNGEQRILEAGDPVYLNEQIITQAGTTASIRLMDNRVISVQEQSSLVLNDSFMAGQATDVENVQIDSTDTPDDERTIAEIIEGADSVDVSTATSAGDFSEKIQPETEVESDYKPDSGGYSYTPEIPQINREDSYKYKDDYDDSSNQKSDEYSTWVRPQQEKVEFISEVTGNYIPIAQSSSMSGSEDDNVLEGRLYAKDSKGDELTFYLLSKPEKGSIILSEDGSFRFEPGTDFQYLSENEQASVGFVFGVRDSRGSSSQSSVEINIIGANDTPETAQAVEHSIEEGSGILSVNLLEHASDVDVGDSLYVSNIRLQSGNEAGVSFSLDGNGIDVDPGAYEYLAEGETETLVYEYRVSDIQGDYVIQTAEITITGENDLPTISSAVVYEGGQNSGSVRVNLLDGASDTDLSDSLSVVSLRLEAGDPQGITFDSGTNTLEIDSSAYAELAEGETETVEYSYQVDDGHGGQVEQTATVEIEGINDGPTSQDSQTTINEDTPYTFTLSDFPYSDVDNNDQLDYVQISTLPDEGLIFLNGQPVLAGQDISRADIDNGLLVFTPEDNASGDDYSSFTFRVSDGDLLSGEQTFSIDVVPVADAPETTNASATIDEDTSYFFTASDFSFSDADTGDNFEGIQIAQLPVAGTLLFNSSAVTVGQNITKNDLLAGRLKFEPALNENGEGYASFEFKVSDGELLSEVASFNINVTPVTDAAVIGGDDTGAATEDAAGTLEISGTLTISDADDEENSFTVETISGNYGNLSISSDGSWTYQAGNSQSNIQSLGDGDTASESLSVRAIDGTVHNIIITITGTNDAAQIAGASSATITEDIAVTTGDQLLASGQLNVTDVDNGEAFFSPGVVSGTYGSLNIDSSGNWVYTADNTQGAIQSLGGDDHLVDTLTVTTLDGSTQNITITINGSNDVAQISGVNAGNVTEDGAAQLTTSGQLNITDADDGEDEFIAESLSGIYGDITIDEDGNWSYSANNSQTDIQRLNEDESLTDSFTVRSVDGATKTINITLHGENDAPELQSGSFSVVENSSNGSVLGTVTTNDVDSSSLTYSLTDDADGRFVINSSTGEITVANSSGLNYESDTEHTITVQVSDGQLSDTQSYTISVLNQIEAPVISSAVDETGTDDSGILSINLLENATAVESGETLSINSLSLIAGDDTGVSFNGLTMNVDASLYAYLPDGVSETIQYTYNVVGSEGGSSLQTVSITITGNNEAAVISGIDTASLTEDSINDSNELVANGSLTVSDADRGEEAFVATELTGLHGTLNLDEDGNWSYTADNNQVAIQELSAGDTLEDGFTITSDDGTEHQIVITINGTNDAAVISGADTGTLQENSSATLTTSGLLTITDADSDEAEFTHETVSGSYGSLTINASGSWTYSASNTQSVVQELGSGDTLTETIQVSARDGTTQDIVITINGTNDAPVVSSVDLGSTDEDTSIVITEAQLLANASDIEGDTLSITALALDNPASGTLIDNGNGTWNFTPGSNLSAQDVSFSFTVSDGTTGDEVTTAAVIDITAVADEAVVSFANADSYTIVDETIFRDGRYFGLSGSEWSADGNVAQIDIGRNYMTLSQGTTISRTIDTSGDDVQNYTFKFEGSVYGNLEVIWDGQVVGTASTTSQVLSRSSFKTLTFTLPAAGSDSTVLSLRYPAGQGQQDYAAAIARAHLVAHSNDSDNPVYNTLEDTAVDIELSAVLADQDTSETLGIVINNVPAGATISDGVNSELVSSGTLDITGWDLSSLSVLPPANSISDFDLSLVVTSTETNGDIATVNKTISINVTAVNDAAVISGASTGAVTEDAMTSMLTTSGLLSVTDVDTGEASFRAATVSGSYGSLTIDASGSWAYSSSNTQNAVQALGSGDTLTETIQVSAQDGTTQDIVITINGTNDAAVIGGASTGTITEDSSASTLTTTGSLSITDTDSEEASFSAATVSGTYGSLTINTSGSWTYSASNTQSAVQALGSGDTLTETIQVSAQDGTTQDIVITINGTNDAAVIGGTSTSSIAEDSSDSTLTATGSLSITDTDSEEASFSAATVSGTYGSLTINTSGSWTYSASNTQSAVQELGSGDTLTETIQVTAEDGTTQDIVITINGTNNAAVIGGASTGTITEDSSASTLTTTGSLSITDTDSGEASFRAATVSGTYGSLTINTSGSWTYSASNTQSAVQALGSGDTLTETIQVSAQDGTTQDIVITINGTNDAAVISGASTGTITEDSSASTLTTTGSLSITDTDSEEASFSAATVSGTYGSLTINASGSWTYSASNTQSAVQELGSGDTLTETIEVIAQDGTTQDIVITINGTNDTAVINGDSTGTITEDSSASTLTTTGSLSITDRDSEETSFRAATVSGTYGSLTIDASGSWTYSASNTQSAVQELGSGDTLTETIEVTAQDGTTQDIVITINGTNDAAVIGGTSTGSITEDSGDSTLTTSGLLNITDEDTGEGSFRAATVSGSYGSLTIDASGSWTYSASNTQSAVQELGSGDTLTETIQVAAQDGTTQDIVITINGTNDAAVIGGTSTGSITEDSSDSTLTTSGLLSITDEDAGEASFRAATVSGSYGSLTIDASGSWTYSASNTQNAVQELGSGDTLTETIEVTAQDGTTQDIVITINGTNDAAVIGGTSTGSITEDSGDSTLTTSGLLNITDEDTGEGSFRAATVSGSYGSLTIDASGSWTYSASNTQSAVQELGSGDTLTETIQVAAQDGTTQDIVITINGTNDAAVIGGTSTGSITEDSGDSTLTTSGLLSITDEDTGEGSFRAATVSGSYGSLTIDASGSWTYSASNTQSAVQELGSGDTLTETIEVTAQDGTTQDIVITINGTNDAAVIDGTSTGSITEDSGDSTLTTSGLLSITDGDTGEASYRAATVSGTYGSLTINASGSWTYSASNTQSVVQELGSGDTLTETIQVSTQDGTTQDIVITINGTNDAPVVSSVDLGSTNEDTNIVITQAQLLANTFDIEGDALSVTTLTLDDSANGVLTSNGDGTWNFIPASHLSAENVALSFTVSDGTTGNEVTAATVIDITAVADEAVVSLTNPDSYRRIDDIVFSDGDYVSSNPYGGWSVNGDTTFRGLGRRSYLSLRRNTAISQTIDTSNDDIQNYTFEFEASVYGNLEVIWDGQVIGTVSTTSSISNDSYRIHTFTLPAIGNDSAVLSLRYPSGSGQYDYRASIARTNLTAHTLDNDNPIYNTSEDVAVPINLTAELVDRDTSETLNVVINNIPTGVTISDGVNSQLVNSGTLNITGWDLSSLSVLPPANSTNNFDLSLVVTSMESNGAVATVNKTISIHVTAVNDAATFSGDNSGSVTEDVSAMLTASGALTVSDVDDESRFTVATVSGSYGSLTIDASGSWTYSASNTQSAVQALGSGDTLTEIIQVAAQDGTTQNIVITINGTNDIAVISGTSIGAVTEDASASTLSATGILRITDTDSGEARFTAEVVSGAYGSLSIDASGSWTYSANNAQSAIQELGSGDTLTETIQVTAQDGTAQNIVITINGTNDAPIASDNTLLLRQRNSYTFKGGDFGFSDENSGDTLHSIAITALPASGSLTLNGTVVAAGQVISAADIANLVYTAPATNDNLRSSFTFTVSDGSLSSNSQTFNLNIRGASSQNLLTGSDNAEIIVGSNLSETIDASAGNDIVIGDDAGAVTVNLSSDFISRANQIRSPDITVDVASGVTLSAGTNNGDGTWILNAADLSGLTMSGSDNSWDDSLTFTVTQDVSRSISIADASFESVSVSDGRYIYRPSSSGWVFSANRPNAVYNSKYSGIANFSSREFNRQATDGSNAGVVHLHGTAISQTLAEIFDRNSNYQLQVDIGNLKNYSGMGRYEVRLTAGDVVLVGDGSVTPDEGEFETLTINLDGSTIASDSAAIGQPISIELVQTGRGNGENHKVAFDNVRLTATTTEQVAQETVNTDQSDIITGGEGNDILTGGNDSDTFVWHIDHAGTAENPAEDTITDFHVGQGGDVLDLRDLLVDEQNHQLDDYLHFNFDGGDTTLEISSQANGDVTQKVILQNMNLSSLGATDIDIINQLLSDGNLQIDT